MAHIEAEGTPPAGSGRAHKRVQWRRPAGGGKRRPGVLDATRAELVRGLEHRHGSIWFRVRRAVIVAGYPVPRALDRVRSLRADGAESLLAMAVALLYLADVRTGFIGKPPAGGGRWHRYTLADLAQLAFGAQGEADLRRARRALDMMVSLGWAFPTKQVRRYAGEHTWRSEAAVRRLNLARLCEMAGTTWLLARDRQHADRTRGTGAASMQDARQRRQRPQEARSGLTVANAVRSTPPATGDPPARTGGVQHVAAILDLLGKG